MDSHDSSSLAAAGLVRSRRHRQTKRGSSSAWARPWVTALLLPVLAILGAASLPGPGLSDAGLTGERSPTAASGRAQGSVEAAGSVVIRITLNRSGRGSFSVHGAISDAGSASGRRSLEGQRVQLAEALKGLEGTIVIQVTQMCGTKTSTWRVVRGTNEYAGLSGGGTGTGSVGCGSSRTSIRGVYRGTVQTPSSAQFAEPGTYGGWTSQNERLSFDVLPDGRSLSNVRVERLYATCTPSLAVTLEPAFLATYPIASDGTFSITLANSTIAGRFSGAAATGSLAYTSSETAPHVCSSGSVSWAASSPPPPLPAALPGTYCGSTAQGLGVCLKLTPGGRLTYLRIEARLDCVLSFVDGERVAPEQAQFEVVMGFAGGSVPLRSNLAFEVLGSLGGDAGISVVGDAGGEYVVRGSFDPTGKVSGTLSLYRTSFDDLEGRLYTCADASIGWQVTHVT